MKTTRIELKDSGVLFNKELHEYWLGNKQLSGITGMLQRQLFPDEFDNVPEEAIKEAARYGTEVHESIETFDASWINDGTQEVLDYSLNLIFDFSLFIFNLNLMLPLVGSFLQ